MSINAISPLESHFFQTTNPDGISVRVARQNLKNADGKSITKEYGDINNPNGSRIDSLLEHLQGTSGINKDDAIFKEAMKNLDGVKTGAIKIEAPKIDNTTPNAQKTSDTVPSKPVPQKEKITISNDDMKQAAYSMRQDMQKGY
jgi:hypothetical protein